MSARISIPTLLSTLRTSQATSPALVWYGPEAERIELSGRVLDNWVAKTSNLLVEELDAEPGVRVRLDLPAHWKTLVWALAAWQTGCTVVLGDSVEEPGADVTVTASQDVLDASSGTVVAVAQGAMELRWTGGLPAGAVDFAAEVRSFADTFMPDQSAEEDFTALFSPAGPGADGALALTYGALAELTAAEAAGAQTLLVPALPDLPAVLTAALRTWAAGGTVVLTAPEVEITERLLAAERVTARLAG